MSESASVLGTWTPPACDCGESQWTFSVHGAGLAASCKCGRIVFMDQEQMEFDAPPGPAHWLETSDLASVCREAFIAANEGSLVGAVDVDDARLARGWEAAAMAVARRVKGDSNG